MCLLCVVTCGTRLCVVWAVACGCGLCVEFCAGVADFRAERCGRVEGVPGAALYRCSVLHCAVFLRVVCISASAIYRDAMRLKFLLLVKRFLA